MAASINRVTLIGNLGSDPELRHTQSGTPVTNFNIATTERWNKKDGGREEKTEWHRIVAWGRTAELCAQYLSKGRSVYIEGRLQTNEWENREGQKQRTTEIVANIVQFLGGGRGEGGGRRDDGDGGRRDYGDGDRRRDDGDTRRDDGDGERRRDYASQDVADDDVPF